MGQSHGGGPARRLVPFLTPQFVAGLFVKGGHKIFPFMVPIDNQFVLIQERRTSLPKTGPGLHLPQRLGPARLTFHRKRMQPARTKIRIDHLPVRHRRMRGKSVVPMMPFMRQFLLGHRLPLDLPRRQIQTHQYKLLHFGRGFSAPPSARPTRRRLGPSRRRRFDGFPLDRFPGPNRGRDEDFPLPDDRSRGTGSRQRFFPPHIGGFAPRHWRRRARCHPIPLRTAPLRPVAPSSTQGQCEEKSSGVSAGQQFHDESD